MQPHLGSVGLRGWVQRDLWVKCSTSAECKTNRLAVLTVMSGLDPHMIKLWNQNNLTCVVTMFLSLNSCLCFTSIYIHSYVVKWDGTYLNSLVIIKFDQYKPKVDASLSLPLVAFTHTIFTRFVEYEMYSPLHSPTTQR